MKENAYCWYLGHLLLLLRILTLTSMELEATGVCCVDICVVATLGSVGAATLSGVAGGGFLLLCCVKMFDSC